MSKRSAPRKICFSSPSPALAGERGVGVSPRVGLFVRREPPPGATRRPPPQAGEVSNRASTLQELTGLVERAKLHAGFGKRFGSTLLAVDHRENEHDLAAGVAHGLGRLQCRTAGRG